MDEALPSRGEFYSCRFVYLREKGERDRERAGEGDESKGLWIYDGKLFDLAEYAAKHPGGRGTYVLCVCARACFFPASSSM